MGRKVVHLWEYCMQMWQNSLGSKWVFNILKTIAWTFATFIFAFGGMIIGGIAGAMKGQTTETGFCRGAAIGVISGSIVAVDLIDSLTTNGHLLSKMALFGSIFNGKAFREWVSPAVLKSYQWLQTSMNEGSVNLVSDLYNFDEVQGMSSMLINKLPLINFHRTGTSCAICLQDLMEGERARVLGVCDHLFHQLCIDEWLTRNASCPICRNTVDFNLEY